MGSRCTHDLYATFTRRATRARNFVVGTFQSRRFSGGRLLGLESPGYRRCAPLRHMPDDRVQHCQPRHLRSGGEILPQRLAPDRLHLHGAAEFVVNQRGRTVAAKRKAALDLPVGKRIGNRVPEPARGIEQLIHERTRLRTQRRIAAHCTRGRYTSFPFVKIRSPSRRTVSRSARMRKCTLRPACASIPP